MGKSHKNRFHPVSRREQNCHFPHAKYHWEK